MTHTFSQPIACREPLNKPLTADDGIALALSVIRGRMFGTKSQEVKLIRAMIERCGFEIRPKLKIKQDLGQSRSRVAEPVA